MMTVEEFRRTQRAHGPATILAIGTAVPSNCVDQSTYPDYYFRVTKSEHMTELKEKFQRMCNGSMIKKRYLHLTEKILDENPNMGAYMKPSFDSRQNISVQAVPVLAKQAAQKAIEEWGQPVTKITHLIFTTISGISMPGADYRLTELLGLPLSTKRYMMYNLGCYSGGTVLRVAKDLAENNAGARVLVVSSEITVPTFHGPTDAHLDNLVAQALFSDGAAALIVGADPVAGVERPLYQIVSAAQTIVPNTDTALCGDLGEAGLICHISKDVPLYAAMHIEKLLKDAFDPLGISDWNSIFWILHPGGPAILQQIEQKLALHPGKLQASRHVLNEYGNMLGVCVLFILDYMRKSSTKEAGMNTTGEGCDWGVLFGIGPGLTIETVVLRSVTTN